MLQEKDIISVRRGSESTSESQLSDPKKEVEGGTEAWLTVAGSFLVYYASFGLINSFGYFQDYYKRQALQSTSATTIAFIGTLQMTLMNIIGPVSGALCDSYGVKVPSPQLYLYVGSGVGVSGSLLLLSYMKPLSVSQAFLIQAVLMGISMSFGVQPALTAVGQHFKRRRGFAMSVVFGGCALGGLCYPLMFSRLEPVIGFWWSLRVAALKAAVCYSVALFISTSKPIYRPWNVAWTTLLDYRGFKDRRYAVLCLGIWFAQIGIWVPNYYIESYCFIIDPNSSIKGNFLPLINGTSILGMIMGGFFGDIIGRLNVLYPVTLTLSLLCIIWILSTTITALIIFSVLFGFFSGIYVGLAPSVVSQICPDEKMGARIGAFYSIVAIGNLIGAPIGGALITGPAREDYRWVILYAACSLGLGACVMLVSRLLHTRNLKVRW
ncbi:MFS general substrate transporter [Sporormia fimetaria CBS 119925]|uniref:MFS general substrate transporter n=1 Tax=Sporormia fimetaria CBS 119925 TaxID=1340428 RepID=A0A6A6VMV7_9PLEO|nr:MFS general substrate transporter [Sporormia fimetaria CBS 119925]